MKAVPFLLFMLSVFCIRAQTLDDYLIMAIDSNPGLQASYAEFQGALQKIPQVKSLPDPTLSISAFGQMTETRVGQQQAIFILNQMFPWFGTLRAEGDAMALFAEARFQSWLNARNELLYKVKAAWYPLYELDQSIRFQEKNLTILESYKTLAQSRLQYGDGTMVDVIRVDIKLDDLRTELSLMEQKRKPLLAAFNALLNRDTNAPVTIPDTLVPVSELKVYAIDSMLLNNPRLTELDKKAQAWAQQQVAAGKEGMPKLGVGLNYTIVGKRTDVEIPDNGKDAFMPMFSISLPLYRNKYKARVEESRLMETAALQSKQDVANGLLASWESARYEVDKAITVYNLNVSQIEKTRQASTLLLSAYSHSGEDLEEVLRMQQELLKYETAMATATKDYYTAIARLQYLTAIN